MPTKQGGGEEKSRLFFSLYQVFECSLEQKHLPGFFLGGGVDYLFYKEEQGLI